MRELNGESPNAAGRARYKDSTTQQGPERPKCAKCRNTCDRYRACGTTLDFVGDDSELACVNGTHFGPCTARPERAHANPLLGTRAIGGRAHDDTGCVPAGYLAWLSIARQKG